MEARVCHQCQKKVASHFKTCPFCKGRLPGSGKKPGGVTLKTLLVDLGAALKTINDSSGKIGPQSWQHGNKDAAEESAAAKPGAAECEKTPPTANKPKPKAKLMNCKDCGHGVSKNAKSCPHCGSEKYDPEAVWGEGFFSFLVLLVMIYMLYQCAGVFFDDNSSENPPEISAAKQRERDAGMARAGAETVLKQTLRDPGSYEEIHHSVIPHKTKPNVLGVYLKYRAKNGFGGYEVADAAFLCVRSTYNCALAVDE